VAPVAGHELDHQRSVLLLVVAATQQRLEARLKFDIDMEVSGSALGEGRTDETLS